MTKRRVMTMSKMLSNPQWAAVCEKAKGFGETVREYLEKAKHNFVVVQISGDAIHWDTSAYDYVVYGDAGDAAADIMFIGERVITEYAYLVSKGFDWDTYESQGLI